MARKWIAIFSVAIAAAIATSSDEGTAATASSINPNGVCESYCFSDDTYKSFCYQYNFDCPANQTCTSYTVEVNSRCINYACEDPLPICEQDAACWSDEAKYLCQCPADGYCETQDAEDANAVWKCVVAATTDTSATEMP